MSIGIQIGQRAEAGWDDPLSMLSDCHRRIEHFLGVLGRVAEFPSPDPLPDEACRALEAALSYFSTSGRLHTADEEESLFPRLRVLGLLESEAAALEAEHDRAEQLHTSSERLLLQWTERGLAHDEYVELRSMLDALQTLYARHIAEEDGTIFPAARRGLPAEAIEAIGKELATRRKQAAQH